MLEILLLIIGILSVAGTWYIYKRSEDEDTTKKLMTILLAVIVVMSTGFMIFDAHTRSVALATGENNQLTLFYLLGLTGSGYSPYIPSSWGGTEPHQDFDFDGIKNEWDQDADNDGVNDGLEGHGLRFNPYQPDRGIDSFQVEWVTDDELHIIAEAVVDISGLDRTIILTIDGVVKEEKPFGFGHTTAVFYVDVNPDAQYTLELIVEGIESDYANKCNNIRSYTVPPGIMGVIGVFYSNLESEIQGIISNNPIFQTNNLFNNVDNLFRSFFAGIPLIWIIIIAVVAVGILLISWRRKKKGKPPFMSFGRKKKPKYAPGDKVIKLY